MINGEQLYEAYRRIASLHGGAGHLVSWQHMQPTGQKVMNELADWVNVEYVHNQARTIDVYPVDTKGRRVNFLTDEEIKRLGESTDDLHR